MWLLVVIVFFTLVTSAVAWVKLSMPSPTKFSASVRMSSEYMDADNDHPAMALSVCLSHFLL